MRAALKGTVLNMQPTVVKGIVSPYNFISVIIYSLTCCPKPVLIYFLWRTQKKIFQRMWVTKQLLVHLIVGYKKILWKLTGDQQLFGFPHSSK